MVEAVIERMRGSKLRRGDRANNVHRGITTTDFDFPQDSPNIVFSIFFPASSWVCRAPISPINKLQWESKHSRNVATGTYLGIDNKAD